MILFAVTFLVTNLLISLVLLIYCICQQGFRQAFSGLNWWGNVRVAVIFLLLVAVIWPYAFYRTWTYGEEA
jgi:hypothetical protein